MDTVARHPLTSLCVIAAFVALSLWLSFKPERPKGVRGGTHAPTFELGSQTEVSGRLTSVETNARPAQDGVVLIPTAVLQLDLGRVEAVCVFPVGGDIGGVQVGDALTIVGRVNDFVPGHDVLQGRVYLGDCKLIPAAKP